MYRIAFRGQNIEYWNDRPVFTLSLPKDSTVLKVHIALSASQDNPLDILIGDAAYESKVTASFLEPVGVTGGEDFEVKYFTLLTHPNDQIPFKPEFIKEATTAGWFLVEVPATKLDDMIGVNNHIYSLIEKTKTSKVG